MIHYQKGDRFNEVLDVLGGRDGDDEDTQFELRGIDEAADLHTTGFEELRELDDHDAMRRARLHVDDRTAQSVVKPRRF